MQTFEGSYTTWLLPIRSHNWDQCIKNNTCQPQNLLEANWRLASERQDKGKNRWGEILVRIGKSCISQRSIFGKVRPYSVDIFVTFKSDAVHTIVDFLAHQWLTSLQISATAWCRRNAYQFSSHSAYRNKFLSISLTKQLWSESWKYSPSLFCSRGLMTST